ncbi:MAG: hypothetical protein WBW79_17580 [Desulfocapsaceae bacterium]|jgi:hypothetical protein
MNSQARFALHGRNPDVLTCIANLSNDEVFTPPEFVEFRKTGSKQEKGGESAVSSEQSLDGKLFVQFIALIFLFSVTRKMQQSNLFKDFTMQEVLGEFDIIECFEVPGQKLQVGETTKRQMDLYTKFGAAPLTSLQ